MIYENSNQLIKDIEKCIQEASRKNPFEYLDQAKQIRKESEEKMRKIIQTKRDEIIELKNESGNLELEESTITKTYNAVNEEYAQNETELKRQEALQAIEIAEMDQLREEIRLMESELSELEGPETSLAAVPPNELRLMLYRGLGVSTGDLSESTMIENNMAETIVLTTSDGHDILTMGLNQYGIDYLSNQVWEFISK